MVAIEIVKPAITRVAAMSVLTSAPLSRATECARAEITQAVRASVRSTPWRGVLPLDET